MEVNLKVIETYDAMLADLERTILKLANHHDPVSYTLLQSVYGIGKIGALTILYEIEDIRRFPCVQDFASYARLVKCSHESLDIRHKPTLPGGVGSGFLSKL